jgi:hypothetical protein
MHAGGEACVDRSIVNKDQKIKSTLECLQESLRELRAIEKDKPETPISDIGVRTWLFATQVHLEHLETLLHDLQPSLF